MSVADLPAGAVEANGKVYMTDAKGALVPIELVRQQDRLQDDTVRALFDRANDVADAIAAFKTRAFADIDAFNALIAERYGAKVGGPKGNITFSTFDGLRRIQVQVADHIEFGPEIQAAKSLVDKCLEEWSADSRAEIRKLVMDAFDVDKEGKLNRSKLFSLMRLDIADDRWGRAMTAIKDSIRVVGSKRFVRFYFRADCQAPWQALSLDAATA